MASLSRSTLTRDGAFELPSLPGLKFTAKVRRRYRYRTRLSLLSSVAFVDAALRLWVRVPGHAIPITSVFDTMPIQPYALRPLAANYSRNSCRQLTIGCLPCC